MPTFDIDVSIVADGQALADVHKFYTSNIYRSVVMAALDLHWRYNALLLVPGFGMRVPWMRRSAANDLDALEFASTFYAYNR